MQVMKLAFENKGFVIILRNNSEYCIGPFSSQSEAKEYAGRYLVEEYEIVPLVLKET